MMLIENWFLVLLALVWIAVAVIQDFRKREVSNWLNFSLIAIALAYRAFVSIWLGDASFFLYGLGGFIVFLILGNLFYYLRVFAGGDAKLMIALWAVLPLSSSIVGNVWIFIIFIFLLVFSGGIYSLIYTFVLMLQNRKAFSKKFEEYFKKNVRSVDMSVIIGVIIAIFLIYIKQYLLILFAILVILFPLLYIYAKAVEECCMIKRRKIKDLVEGDWLYREIMIGKKKLKPHWEGLSQRDLLVLKKSKNQNKEILIKEGLPFTPSFLIALLVLIWFLR